LNPSIIIADDHPLVLKGLHNFLTENNYNVLASAKNGKEALTLIKAHNPDIAILDIKMPFFSGLEIAEQCRNEGLATKIVLITFEKNGKIFSKAKELDVYGYVLKEFALEELENCINSISSNKPYFSPELVEFIELEEQPKYYNLLTEHEKNIVTYISNNKTAVEIAEMLSISPRTVEKHKSNIIKKLKLERKQNSLLIWAKDHSDYLNTSL
jgi:DNA-binding NarL/FixJ family response regulator